jgi:Protein of unknown function (DUF3558)
MSKNRLGGLAAIAALALGGGACGSSLGGNPPTSTPSSSDSAAANGSSSVAAGVPKIDTPKDASTIAACQLLKPDQVSQVGISGAGRKSDSPGEVDSCKWTTWITNTQGISVGVGKSSGGGLDNVYSNRDELQEFSEFRLAGYPAVHGERAGVDPNRSCDIYVGISVQQVFDVSVQNEAGDYIKDLCGTAKKLGQFVLSNLPAGR